MVQKFSLFALAAAVLSASAAPSFDKRASVTCSSDNTASLMLTNFAGVFFGDFKTTGNQEIYGPLAVSGDFKASNFNVDTNFNGDCSSSDISSYGLVVGGSVDASQVKIKGNAWVPSGTTGLEQQANTCTINAVGSTGLFDFDQAKSNAIDASKTLAAMEPTLQLDSNGKLSSVGSASNGFNVITFSTCNDGSCAPFDATKMSDAKAIFQGIGNWNGAQGMSWPTDGTLVINIPVSTGSTFEVMGNQPTQGMNGCNTIFNFYPSDSNGKYSSGSFTLKRSTGGNLSGFVLAPEASVVDGQNGAFAGTVVGADYSWSGNGVALKNFNAGGSNCAAFQGCLPISNNKEPSAPEVSSSASSSVASSTTSSTSSTTTESSATTTESSSTTTTDDDATTTEDVTSSTTTDDAAATSESSSVESTTSVSKTKTKATKSKTTKSKSTKSKKSKTTKSKTTKSKKSKTTKSKKSKTTKSKKSKTTKSKTTKSKKSKTTKSKKSKTTKSKKAKTTVTE